MRTLAFVVLAVILAAAVAVFALLSGHAAATTAPTRTVAIQAGRSLVRPSLPQPWLTGLIHSPQGVIPAASPSAAPPSRPATAAEQTSPSAIGDAPQSASVATRSVTTPPAASASVGEAEQAGTVWDRLAKCESGGDWQISTGNGYWGGLQEDLNFWRSYGDPRWARPDLAPKSAQIAAAVKARDGGRGYSPWPQCSVKVGLR